MKRLKYIKLWLAIGWILTASIIILSLTPGPPEMPGFHGADKLMHLLAYAVLMYWFGLCYESGIGYVIHGLSLIIMGIFLELIQGKTGYRTFSYYDMIANSLGVILGWFLSRTPLSMALVYLEEKLSFDY